MKKYLIFLVLGLACRGGSTPSSAGSPYQQTYDETDAQQTHSANQVYQRLLFDKYIDKNSFHELTTGEKKYIAERALLELESMIIKGGSTDNQKLDRLLRILGPLARYQPAGKTMLIIFKDETKLLEIRIKALNYLCYTGDRSEVSYIRKLILADDEVIALNAAFTAAYLWDDEAIPIIEKKIAGLSKNDKTLISASLPDLYRQCLAIIRNKHYPGGGKD